MELQIALLVVAVIIFFYFRTGQGSRLLKEKSHHHIVPPASKEDSSSIPVKIISKQYNRYILLNNTTDNYIVKGIKEHLELSGDNDAFKDYVFEMAKRGDWFVIKISQSDSFYVYHNLVGWLTGYEETEAIPEHTIGFSVNITDSQKDYLFFLDPHNFNGDTQIGAFRNGEAFAIYLPEAYEEHGNLTIKKGIELSFEEKVNDISNLGLDVSDIESLEFEECKIDLPVP